MITHEELLNAMLNSTPVLLRVDRNIMSKHVASVKLNGAELVNRAAVTSLEYIYPCTPSGLKNAVEDIKSEIKREYTGAIDAVDALYRSLHFEYFDRFAD